MTVAADRTEWRTEDFDAMSWHDVHVHGFRLEDCDEDDGTAEFLLDIDYILEWIKVENHFNFVVARATLRFHKVFGLKFAVDYSKPTAGMCAFSLAGIERELVPNRLGPSSYKWGMDINWPSGRIEFESPGFTQRLVGPRITHDAQWLSTEQRAGSAA